jgi:hypothetical protein
MGMVLTVPIGICYCLDGYIEENKSLCAACDPSCATCDDTAENSCLTCNTKNTNRLD